MADSKTPDSWDSSDPDVKKLSINAAPFVPNINAAAFVPSFLKTSSVGETTAQTSTVEKAAEETPANWEDEAEDTQETVTPTDTTVNQKSEEKETVDQSTSNQESNSMEDEVEESRPADAPPPASDKTKTPPAQEPEQVVDLREHINIVFIGHVDAGKSTIGGHLLYLTGQVDKRTLEKYEREAKEKNRETWYFSWALDTNLEERDKGKTVECGRASFDTPNKHFTLLDAPGHKGFVPNMIGGAAQADLGVLENVIVFYGDAFFRMESNNLINLYLEVISARRGEFETGFERGGQTREHAMLVKTAGVKHLIVLVNKMDDSTVNWNVERYKEIESKLTPFLKKTGFRSSEVFFMPSSGFTGANLKNPVDPSACPWYTGPTFLGYLDALPAFTRPTDGPLKLLVSDRYKDMGTVVIGKLESGTVVKGESYSLMPNKTPVKILSITGADENEKSSCKAGENVKLKITGVEEEEVLPGFILCSPDILCNTGRVFDAQVVILEHKSIICAGYGAVLHIHNAVEEVKLIALIATIDRKSGEKSKQRPRFVKQDTICIARFKTNNVICMETFADFTPMGRFTLRDEGKTIAMGKVLKIHHKSEQK